ncbi:MAG: hypothetical protein MUP41_16900 [Desulfobacterales bacterium]|nr:hypothetical protein [Desulfobacterales bacterium]
MEKLGDMGEYLETLRGVGYRFRAENDGNFPGEYDYGDVCSPLRYVRNHLS